MSDNLCVMLLIAMIVVLFVLMPTWYILILFLYYFFLLSLNLKKKVPYVRFAKMHVLRNILHIRCVNMLVLQLSFWCSALHMYIN